jgi:hypothetical protein
VKTACQNLERSVGRIFPQILNELPEDFDFQFLKYEESTTSSGKQDCDF